MSKHMEESLLDSDSSYHNCQTSGRGTETLGHQNRLRSSSVGGNTKRNLPKVQMEGIERCKIPLFKKVCFSLWSNIKDYPIFGIKKPTLGKLKRLRENSNSATFDPKKTARKTTPENPELFGYVRMNNLPARAQIKAHLITRKRNMLFNHLKIYKLHFIKIQTGMTLKDFHF